MNSRPPEKEALTLKGPAGRIEGLLEVPSESSKACIAVLCHPHPLHEGTMLNKVVHTLARAMNDLGIPALRFNFRGVGSSEGDYADGQGETDDALAVIDWAMQRYPGARLWLGGFSFGALVSYRAALETEPDQLISIAPAVAGFRGRLTGQPRCRWLIVQGGADEVVSCDEVVAWVNKLTPGPELVILPEVTHFFHGNLVLLRDTLVANLAQAAS